MADFTVQQWLETDDATQRAEMVKDIAGTFDLGLLPFKQLLNEFQPYLGGDATLIQAADALELLSKLLTSIQIDLDRADVHLVVDYLCDRLENTDNIPILHSGIKWTSNALHSLAQMEVRFPRGDASTIAKAVFKLASTVFREQLPATRLAVFDLLEYLSRKYTTPITRDMSAQGFVEGLVAMAEFEKDPRCLKVLFQIYQEISQGWTLKSESFKLMWDSFSRYFPITLKTTDTSVPTRGELQLLLIACFASNNAYAVHAFPYLFNGLDTTEDTLTAYVKNTVLETLGGCVNAYSKEIAAQWCSKIWDALKFEVWDGTNEEFVDRALIVIETIGRKLDDGALDWTETASPFAQYILTTSTECTRRLLDSKQQHILGSGKILRAVASSSSLGLNLVIKSVIPKLLVIWEDLASKDKKTALLSVFNDILRARLDMRDGLNVALSQELELEKDSSNAEIILAASLATFQPSIIDEVLIPAMMETDTGDAELDTSYKVNAIRGLITAARIPSFLPDYHKGTVILQFSQLASNQKQNDAIQQESIHALQQVSCEDFNSFRDPILSTFLAGLPKCLSSAKVESADELNRVVFILGSLIQISCSTTYQRKYLPRTPSHPECSYKFRLFEELQNALLSKLHHVVSLPGQLHYANAILAAIYRGVQVFDGTLKREEATIEPPSSTLLETDPYSWIILNIFEKLAVQKTYEGGSLKELPYIALNINLDSDSIVKDLFYSLLGKLSTFVLRSSQPNAVNNLLLRADREGRPSQIWNLFCLGTSAKSLQTAQQNLTAGPEEKRLANVLSMSLVAGLRRDDKERLNIHIGNTALSMIENAIMTKDCSPVSRISMFYFVQLLINKFGATKEKIDNEDRGLARIMLDLTVASTSNSDEMEVQRTYQTLAYFTAASLAIGDSSVKDLIAQMISGISNPNVGRKVAQSFRLLLAPSEVMNEENFCIIRKLRKQRLYHQAVDQLIGKWRANDSKDLKENILIALAGIFANMDPKVLHDNAEKIFPVIIEGTNVDDDHTMYTNISLICHLVTVCPEIAATHVDSIINRMTDRTHNTYDSPSDASVKCRVAALEVLALLVSHLERGMLLKRKAKIMIELDISLDDCSRSVRSAAERTKMNWFNLVENEG